MKLTETKIIICPFLGGSLNDPRCFGADGALTPPPLLLLIKKPGKINEFKSKADKNEIPGPRVISSLSMIAARKGGQLGWPEYVPYFENPMVKRLIGGNFAERPATVGEIKEVSMVFGDSIL